MPSPMMDRSVLRVARHHPFSGLQWGTQLGYSYSDNDLKRQLLYDEITGVELILLMEDMDSVLRAARDTNAANETSS